MTPLEHLRLATALVHVAPGAELELRSRHGSAVVVGHGVYADVDPCALRSVVIASASPRQPDLGARIHALVVGGALVDHGGGIFRTATGGVEQRWVATLLPAARVASIFEGLAFDDVPDDAIDVRLRHDIDLAVTVIVITASDPRFDHRIDDVAGDVAAACFVDELCGSTSSTRASLR